MMLRVDRSSSVPLAQQIAAAIRDEIRARRLGVGARLPSSRELADQLGVNRATVVHGYRELQEDGWIESGVGRGSFVAQRQDDAGSSTSRPADTGGVLQWRSLVHLSPAGPEETIPPTDGERPGTPLARAVAHHRLFPVEPIHEALEHCFRRLGAEILGYAPAAGYEPLREALKHRLASRGIDPARNEVLVVNGSQQGLDLIGRLLLDPAATVVTSRPSFAGALTVFRSCGARLDGVALDSEGIDPAAVARSIARQSPQLIYTIPDCHNPTGVTLSESRREQLLELARRHHLPILEDDWLADLRTPGDAAPLKARDEGGHVIYLGTVSKVLVPGFRVGWLVVPREIFEPLLAIKRRSDLATNLPGQALLHELLTSGEYDRLVDDLRRSLDLRRQLVDDAIDRFLPAEVRPLRPHRGMVLWLRLPPMLDPARVASLARREGLELTASVGFDPQGTGLAGLRISYATAEEHDLGPAMKTLGEVLEAALSSSSAGTEPPLV